MTANQLRDRIDEIYKVYGELDKLNEADKVIESLLESECFKVLIHAPHLDENLISEFVPLLDSENICPHADKVEDQKCLKCPYYVAHAASEDGSIFSFNIFTSYCAKEI